MLYLLVIVLFSVPVALMSILVIQYVIRRKKIRRTFEKIDKQEFARGGFISAPSERTYAMIDHTHYYPHTMRHSDDNTADLIVLGSVINSLSSAPQKTHASELAYDGNFGGAGASGSWESDSDSISNDSGGGSDS